MTLNEFKDVFDISIEFFNTIDFRKFMSDEREILVSDLMDCVEEYYGSHADLIPKELQGYVFNCVTEEEFADYLKSRYGYRVRDEIIERYYIIRPTEG